MSELPILPEDEGNDKQSTLREMLSLLKTAIFVTPLVLMCIVVVLSLMGPAVGNIFSNIVSTL